MAMTDDNKRDIQKGVENLFTRAVLVLPTERKNKVDPCLRSQTNVNEIYRFIIIRSCATCL